MADYSQDKVAAFDTLFTNNHIQMLKILVPYFDSTIQKNLAIYIKYLEFQYTLDLLKKYPNISLTPTNFEKEIVTTIFDRAYRNTGSGYIKDLAVTNTAGSLLIVEREKFQIEITSNDARLHLMSAVNLADPLVY